ncbi:hypothetical protein CYMTET_48283 [Cymbomonas tetramitiformis]|uniref:RCC1-like domain-containing protein n=1 Tax=Cymbomonas tetramitiformis TaxID=36881 RepID=A0AAE0EWW9_9CHLO|nr:hypothetical protein CYMTET_48283 [Cymbomonas tetramitiformis]
MVHPRKWYARRVLIIHLCIAVSVEGLPACECDEYRNGANAEDMELCFKEEEGVGKCMPPNSGDDRCPGDHLRCSKSNSTSTPGRPPARPPMPPPRPPMPPCTHQISQPPAEEEDYSYYSSWEDWVERNSDAPPPPCYDHHTDCSPGGLGYATGLNTQGQLGDGTNISTASPGEVSELHTLAGIAAGNAHSLFLMVTGQAFATGENGNGQLGDGSTDDQETPVAVLTGMNVSRIAAGDSHSLFLLPNGAVYATGLNNRGQLGDGSMTDAIDTAVRVMAEHVVAGISGGQYHSVFVTVDGLAYAVGENQDGQLGNNSTSSSTSPVRVLLPSEAVVIEASCGRAHTLLLASNGQAYATGKNSKGQLGDGSEERRLKPVQVRLNATVVMIAGGKHHSLFLTDSGPAFSVGGNKHGQLGDGTQTPQRIPVPVLEGYQVTEVATMHDASLFRTAASEVYACGENSDGQLGDGTTDDRYSPVRVMKSFSVVRLAGGARHSLFLEETRVPPARCLPPPPPPAPPVTIFWMVLVDFETVVDMDIALLDEAQYMADFNSDYVAEVANAANTSSDAVFILNITAGSVRVATQIGYSSDTRSAEDATPAPTLSTSEETTIEWQGSAEETCVQYAINDTLSLSHAASNVTGITITTLDGPSNLTWHFTTPAEYEEGSLCGFVVGSEQAVAYQLEARVRYTNRVTEVIWNATLAVIDPSSPSSPAAGDDNTDDGDEGMSAESFFTRVVLIIVVIPVMIVSLYMLYRFLKFRSVLLEEATALEHSEGDADVEEQVEGGEGGEEERVGSAPAGMERQRANTWGSSRDSICSRVSESTCDIELIKPTASVTMNPLANNESGRNIQKYN